MKAEGKRVRAGLVEKDEEGRRYAKTAAGSTAKTRKASRRRKLKFLRHTTDSVLYHD